MKPTDEEVERMASEIAGTVSNFALPFIRGLVKLRHAADSGQGCTLPPEEAKAIVDALKLLRGPR